MKPGLILLCIMLVACGAGASEEQEQASSVEIRTSVCELVNNAARMNGLHVRIKATYSSDLKHYSGFSDAQCPGLNLAEGIRKEDVPELEEFYRAVWGDLDDGTSRIFLVDVSGVFNWNEQAASATPGPDGLPPQAASLQIVKVWSYRRLKR